MSSRNRREFLKTSAVVATAIGLPSCSPSGAAGDGAAAEGGDAARRLDPVLLRSVSEVVLPDELGPTGREDAVAAFEHWLAGFEPAVERPHPYIAPDISYGPPDPAPGWNAQLKALDVESHARFQAGFNEIELSRRERMIRRQIDDSQSLPDTARARHVAVGLMSHFFSSSTAVDLCYDARIGKETCRGLGGLEGAPAPERLSSRNRAGGGSRV